jgi:hypothetical protein
MRLSYVRNLAFSLALLAPLSTTHAAGKSPKPEVVPAAADKVDISVVKDSLKALTDGHGHYLVIKPFGPHDHSYYGDGKTFYALRVGSASASGTESFSFVFWEPRVQERYQASFEFRENAYEVQCADRKTTFTSLSPEESTTLIAGASFYAARWKYEAYALARDNKGTYYFVDHQREPEGNRVFRVFRGMRGNMKQMKLTNVVSDSEGEIFATKTGDLRLILDKKETSWVRGKANTKLVSLELFPNIVLIYTDLGPYIGQRLGTPCDDL